MQVIALVIFPRPLIQTSTASLHHPCPRRVRHDCVLHRRADQRDGASCHRQEPWTAWRRSFPAHPNVPRTSTPPWPNPGRPAASGDGPEHTGTRHSRCCDDPASSLEWWILPWFVWARSTDGHSEARRETGHCRRRGDDECSWCSRTAGASSFRA